MVSTYALGDLEQLGAVDLHSGLEVLDGLETLDGLEVSDQLLPNGLADPLGMELLELLNSQPSSLYQQLYWLIKWDAQRERKKPCHGQVGHVK